MNSTGNELSLERGYHARILSVCRHDVGSQCEAGTLLTKFEYKSCTGDDGVSVRTALVGRVGAVALAAPCNWMALVRALRDLACLKNPNAVWRWD